MSNKHDLEEKDSVSIRLQTLLDDHKEKLSDDLYNKMCNLNLQINKQENNELYELTYSITIPVLSGYNIYRLSYKTYKQLVKLTIEQYKFILANTKHGESVCADCSCNLLLESITAQLNVNHSYVDLPIQRNECVCYNRDCDDCENHEPSNHISIKSCIRIINVKKMKN